MRARILPVLVGLLAALAACGEGEDEGEAPRLTDDQVRKEANAAVRTYNETSDPYSRVKVRARRGECRRRSETAVDCTISTTTDHGEGFVVSCANVPHVTLRGERVATELEKSEDCDRRR